LLLNDALLKCVVTEGVLFSNVAFKILTFHKGSVATLFMCGGSLVKLLLHMFS